MCLKIAEGAVSEKLQIRIAVEEMQHFKCRKTIYECLSLYKRRIEIRIGLAGFVQFLKNLKFEKRSP